MSATSSLPAAADRPWPVTPLEVAIHWLPGSEPGPRPDPGAGGARAALDAAILPALRRTPCVVMFSGGRDSSLVLARAVALARQEGLPTPVAVTLEFPGAALSAELAWQELVIRHVGISDWERIEVRDQHDMVGPLAQGVYRDLGQVYPALAHCRELVLQRARGGAMLTGEGGDEMLGGGRGHTAAYLLRRGGLARPRTYRKLATELSPRPVRRRRARQAFDGRWPWLRPDALAEAVRLVVEDSARVPLGFEESIWASLDRRGQHALNQTVRLLAERHDVVSVEPLLDRAFAAAWVREWSVLGPTNRAQAMTRLGGDVVPEPVIRRRTKALFNETVIRPASRAFAESWDGSGVDHELVDPEVLRAAWLAEFPDGGSLMLLQQAFFAGHPSVRPSASDA